MPLDEPDVRRDESVASARGILDHVSGVLLPQLSPDADAEEEQRPLLEGTTIVARATTNRLTFERNRQTLAWSLVLASSCVVCLLLIVFLNLFGFSIYFYVSGWFVWANNKDGACDEPLATWLLLTLIAPLLKSSPFGKCFAHRWNRVGHLTLSFVLLVAGHIMLGHSKTCHETNPVLFTFVKSYIVYLTVLWGVLFAVPSLGVIVILIGMRYGCFEKEKGADPLVIKSMETVEFDAAMFASKDDADPSDNRPVAECCCCQEEYHAFSVIKRTPCQHYFHEDCLAHWLKVATTCPLCRLDLQDSVRDGPASV